MSERDVWNGKPGFPIDLPEYIRTRVLMLAAVFNRKATDELVAVFREVLNGYPLFALKKAFTKAESTLERFPTPKVMRELCNEEMPSNGWRYNFTPAVGEDPETGEPVNVLIDPDPSCDFCREPRANHPNHRCQEFKDWGDARVMYKPEDCPEGRNFLKVLRGSRRAK